MNFKEILNMNNVFQKLRTMFYSYSKACSSTDKMLFLKQLQ